jgi:hypothetical protein
MLFFMKRFATFVLTASMLLVPSCSTAPWDSLTTSPYGTPSARSDEEITPAATQTTETQILLETPQILAGRESETIVVGVIRNEADQDFAEISLEISLLDSKGDLLDRKRVSPLLGHLAPGEDSPYAARFEAVDGIASAEVRLLHSTSASFDRASVEFQETKSFETQDGDYAVLGTVSNPSDEPLTLHDFGILLKDDSGAIVDLSRFAAGPVSLMPEQPSPVLLLFDTPTDAGEMDIYADATANRSLAPVELSFTREPYLEFTDQGLPFVLGEIHNDAGYFRWVRLLIAAYSDGELLSCTVTTFPIPIQPDENRAFLESRLPGLVANAESQGIPLDDVEIQIRTELDFSRSFDETPVPLSIEIDRYQSVGSSLLLHGKITNLEESIIKQPTVLGTMRTTTGELVSAGWSVVADTLAPAETLDFVLPLTLPQNTDIVMSEFDLQAVGFYP